MASSTVLNNGKIIANCIKKWYFHFFKDYNITAHIITSPAALFFLIDSKDAINQFAVFDRNISMIESVDYYWGF